MVEVRNVERDLARFRRRLAVAFGVCALMFTVLFGRFFYLQVVRYEDFRAQAEDNRVALVPVPPTRGLVFDRNGELVVENVAGYTLEIVPERTGDLDATIAALGRLVEITPGEQRRFRRLLEESRKSDAVPLKTRLTDEEAARLAAYRFEFPGVEVRARLFRSYPFAASGAHVLGYLGRISPDDQRKLEAAELSPLYSGSTHIGKIGIEKSYERELHGKPGFEEVEVAASGRIVRTLSRTPPVNGSHLVLSIDMRLQRVAEALFGERRGALVAIEPGTGQVLAFVSQPAFDPNLFVDGIDVQTWQALNEDPDIPLMNRPLRGTYPPGSTYKPFMALLGLESGERTIKQTISDPGFFLFGGRRFRDSRPGGHGRVDLHKSIVVSSDVYYYMLANDLGVDRIHDFMKRWGFGQETGIDLEGESTGILPSSDWKKRRFREPWYPGETISVGIGQGYNAFTILQLAHATSVLANRGIVMQPHVVQAIENPVTGERTPVAAQPVDRIPLKREHLDAVWAAMVDVNRTGTGRLAFAGVEYAVAGKTGTAQVIGIKQDEKYDASKIDERFHDHSLYMAFAPAEAPRIALAVIVENGGFGSQAAAPLARQVFDFYLLGKLPEAIAQ